MRRDSGVYWHARGRGGSAILVLESMMEACLTAGRKHTTAQKEFSRCATRLSCCWRSFAR